MRLQRRWRLAPSSTRTVSAALIAFTLLIDATAIIAYDPYDYREEYNLANVEPEPEVFITLSAAVVKSRGGLAERRIQLNWFNIDVRHASSRHSLGHNHTLYLLRRPAGLFRIDEDAVFKRDIGLQSDGQITTHINFPRVIFNKTHLHDECLDYWVALVRREQLPSGGRQRTMVAHGCFRAQPYWMWKNRQMLKHLTLRQMMIPGGCVRFDNFLYCQ